MPHSALNPSDKLIGRLSLYFCMVEDGVALRAGVAKTIEPYNFRRPRQSLSGQTPEEIYRSEGEA